MPGRVTLPPPPPIHLVGGVAAACRTAADAAIAKMLDRQFHDSDPDRWHELQGATGRVQCSVCTALYPPPGTVRACSTD